MADKKTEKKFTADELKRLQTIQRIYQEIQIKFGETHIKSIQLEQQQNVLKADTDILHKQYVETQGKEQNFLNELSEKYGKGRFNLETGVFTPEAIPEVN